MLPGILLSLLALAVGLAGGIFWVRVQHRQKLDAAAEESARIKRRAEAEVEAVRKQAEAEARQKALETRASLEGEVNAAEDRYTELEGEINELADVVAEEKAVLETKREAAQERNDAIRAATDRANSIRGEAKALAKKRYLTLQEVADQTDDECRQALADAQVEQARAESADTLRNLETEPSAASVRQAHRIMGIATERLDNRPTAERQTFNIEVTDATRKMLQDPENTFLQQIEEATTVKMSWINDDQAVRVETGSSIARVRARRCLEKVLSKRASSAEAADKIIETTLEDIQKEVMGKGKHAFRQLGLRVAHPEITELVGRLYFRTSYTQNQWEHVIEASYLSGLMAAELGLHLKLSRRAALLHDIGKALTHEVEGSHALIGGEIARKHGEPDEVVGAVEEHHAEKPTTSVFTLLVAASDAISGARPGARRELADTYGERISELEHLATGFRGVTRAHAVQAGREVRVLVDEKKIDDDHAGELADEIAQKISDEMTFPGQIRVTVIREFSAQEFAN